MVTFKDVCFHVLMTVQCALVWYCWLDSRKGKTSCFVQQLQKVSFLGHLCGIQSNSEKVDWKITTSSSSSGCSCL